MRLKKPVLMLGDRAIPMNTSVAVANLILKFADERRHLDVDKFLQRHLEIVATIFDTTPAEVKDKVPLAKVILEYLDCLEYVARIIKDDVDNAESILRGRGMKILNAVDVERKQGRYTQKNHISNIA